MNKTLFTIICKDYSTTFYASESNTIEVGYVYMKGSKRETYHEINTTISQLKELIEFIEKNPKRLVEVVRVIS